jgi:hypothetical protein
MAIAPGGSYEQLSRRNGYTADPLAPAVPGLTSFSTVCRFRGYDFSSEIESARHRALPSSPASFVNPYNVLDHEHNGIPGDATWFLRADMDDVEIFQIMADSLGLERGTRVISINIQQPGQMATTHFDELGRLAKRYLDKKDALDDQDKFVRYLIALTDWNLGQFFHFGNGLWHQWEAGDCVSFEWGSVPHGTANTGWWDRAILQITGLATPDSRAMLLANDNRIIRLERP